MSRNVDIYDELTNAGMEFNYSVWTQNTRVTLCNVPWNSDYRDIVKFEDQNALNTYINEQTGPQIRLDDMSFVPVNRPIRIEQPFNSVMRFNYLRASNPLQGPDYEIQKDYYYFIQDVRYIAQNTTEIIVQLDVWQSFGYDVAFGNCYIERGHVLMAQQGANDNNGRDYLTIPEGMDLGGEYQISKTYSKSLASAVGTESKDHPYSIMVISNQDLTKGAGDIENPMQNVAKGTNVENLPQGSDIYIFRNVRNFQQWLDAVHDKSWVTQGIVSIMAIPPFEPANIPVDQVSISGVNAGGVFKLKGGTIPAVLLDVAQNWRTDILANRAIPTRYASLKKLMTYPYCVIELTTYTGTPIVLKPESLSGDGIDVAQYVHISPPSPRIMYVPNLYNAIDGASVTGNADGTRFDPGEFFDMATTISNFPTFSTLNNSYVSFLASNKNALAYSHSSADWSQQKALAGNQLSYDQASKNIDTFNQSTQVALEGQAMQAGIGLGSNVIGGAMAGGPAGAALGAIGSIGNLAGTASSMLTTRRQQDITNDNSAYMRDTNKGYADFAANGDYSQAIAGINAKVQDAKMIQPTTSGQVGGEAFMLAKLGWGVHAKVKTLQPAAMAAIGEFWLRYGYAVQRWAKMPASLMVMSKFTFWKLKETYITSSRCPEPYKQAIRGIFEKGVTVWVNPNDIGNVDNATNTPRVGNYL